MRESKREMGRKNRRKRGIRELFTSIKKLSGKRGRKQGESCGLSVCLSGPGERLSELKQLQGQTTRGINR